MKPHPTPASSTLAQNLQRNESDSGRFPGAIHWLPAVAAGVLLCCGTACQSTSETVATPALSTAKITSNILASGDVIGIFFPAAAELNQSQKIRLDGKITLPMVGEITAAGKSLLTVQEELKSKYAAHLQDSTVIVTLLASSSVIYVNGAVGGGGKIMLDRPMTVFEAIMESGGFAPTADRKKVMLTRQVNGKLETYRLDLKNGDGGLFQVRPFDTITVKQSWF